MSRDLSCFKAYDLRGRVPDELDETLAREIGLAYAEFVKPRRVVIGHDIRDADIAVLAHRLARRTVLFQHLYYGLNPASCADQGLVLWVLKCQAPQCRARSRAKLCRVRKGAHAF